MLTEKNKIKIEDLLNDNEKIEANEHYDKNKKDYDEKFEQYKSKLGKGLEGARNFEFYKSIETTIEKIFDQKKIGRWYVKFDSSKQNNLTGEKFTALNRDEYNCLTELCNVAGVNMNAHVHKSDFQIKNDFEFKFKEKDFLELWKNVISGLSNKKLITLENDNNNPPTRVFEYDEDILFNIIKQFSSFTTGVEKQFQKDEKIEKPIFDINSVGYKQLSLRQILTAKDFLCYVTTSFEDEEFGKITPRIKSIFEKNFNGYIDDFDIEGFENICIQKLSELGQRWGKGKWHENEPEPIFKKDLALDEKLKMLDFYYKELPKLTQNRISPRLRLAFLFSLHTGWCSEYVKDIIRQKRMHRKFENVFCAIDALQAYNSSRLDCANLATDLRSVLNFMKEQGIIVYDDNIFGGLNLDISNQNYVWTILQYFFAKFKVFWSRNFKVKNYMKAERFVLYLKNHHLKFRLKSDGSADRKISLFDAIKYMDENILRRRPSEDKIKDILVSVTVNRLGVKDYRYYSYVDSTDHEYIPLKDQKMIAESKNFRGY